jgi:nucleotide-binding universal stress UspA family protein
MYNHILIPTDGSPLSSTAVEKALAFAGEAGAKATVLTVVEPFHVFSISTNQLEKMRVEYERSAREHAANILAQAQFRAKEHGVPCEVIVIESGRPYQTIIDTAAERGCDLIAMASHGRGGVAALVLGSETLKVLTHSAVPVLVFR